MIVRITAGQVPQRRFALYSDIVLKILHIENGLRGVLNSPHNHRRNLDRVPAVIIHFQFVAIKIAGSQRNLETRQLPPATTTALSRPGVRLRLYGSARPARLARQSYSTCTLEQPVNLGVNA